MDELLVFLLMVAAGLIAMRFIYWLWNQLCSPIYRIVENFVTERRNFFLTIIAAILIWLWYEYNFTSILVIVILIGLMLYGICSLFDFGWFTYLWGVHQIFSSGDNHPHGPPPDDSFDHYDDSIDGNMDYDIPFVDHTDDNFHP